MAWNENGNGKDPWQRDGNEPNDLDQIAREWQKKFAGILGGGAGGGAGGVLLVVVLIAAWLLTGFYRVDEAERVAPPEPAVRVVILKGAGKALLAASALGLSLFACNAGPSPPDGGGADAAQPETKVERPQAQPLYGAIRPDAGNGE